MAFSLGESAARPWRSRYPSTRRRLAIQSTQWAMVAGSDSSPVRTCSHRFSTSSPTTSPTAARPWVCSYLRAFSSRPHWMSIAVARRPSRSRIVRSSEGSWLTWRMAGTGLPSRNSSLNWSSSIIASTIAVVPTLRYVATSLMFASPTMTCSRRYFFGSQCGSSRVLTIGRFNVVSSPTSSSKKSARWLSWNGTSPGCRLGCSQPTLPAPQKIWRVTKCGVMWLTIRPNGVSRLNK